MDFRWGELQIVRINKNYWESCWFDSYADRDGDDTKTICNLIYKDDDTKMMIWDIINERVVHLYERNMSKDERHNEILYVIDEEFETSEQHKHITFEYESEDEEDNDK
tara:strand:+ start:1660 stop:1983 length:324 start_codon:yes stop_codon:yes gene_type:complete